MKIRPLQDRVFVERFEAKEKTESGIYIPDAAKDKPQRGTVVAVGKGRVIDGEIVPPLVEPGQIVWFGKYSGSEIEVDDKMLLIVQEDDLIGVEEGE